MPDKNKQSDKQSYIMQTNKMNKKKIINDPIYGFINIHSDLIFDLIEHSYFQRLRRIRQLGLTNLVYPGANHPLSACPGLFPPAVQCDCRIASQRRDDFS